MTVTNRLLSGSVRMWALGSVALAGLLTTLATGSAATETGVERIEPPFWWTNMQRQRLQLLVHGQGLADSTPSLDCPGVQLRETTRVASRNYLFLELELAPSLAPGTCRFRFEGADGKLRTATYRFEPRRPGSAQRAGLSPADSLYVITPDRFANGDPANDSVPGLLEGPARNRPYGRHGGDLQGIIDHLQYIADMGFSHIGLNPVLESDQANHSYHGYASTDYYRVDPRLGSNDTCRELSARARELGLGLLMDLVPNHIGSGHWWMRDPPTADWINHARFVQSTHVREPLHDPHAPDSEKRAYVDGWFVPTMPDLNQSNPLLAEYLIQNAIWWVEFADLAGIRVDNWSYADKPFLVDLTRRLMAEYPDLSIVGGEPTDNPAVIASWQRGKERTGGYVSRRMSLMDFPLSYALRNALVEQETRERGLVRIYRSLADDFLYPNPANLLVFADYHGISRVYTRLDGDAELFRIAMVLVLTTRGIAQLLYGTEILMGTPGTGEHGNFRAGFPGGWTGDAVNGFSGEGLSETAADMQQLLSKLLNWRRGAAAIATGALTHYAPRDGVYAYFRHNEEQRVMVALNKNGTSHDLLLDRFRELLGDRTEAREVLSGRQVRLQRSIEVPARGFVLLEL